jgi:hypothetical protein
MKRCNANWHDLQVMGLLTSNLGILCRNYVRGCITNKMISGQQVKLLTPIFSDRILGIAIFPFVVLCFEISTNLALHCRELSQRQRNHLTVSEVRLHYRYCLAKLGHLTRMLECRLPLAPISSLSTIPNFSIPRACVAILSMTMVMGAKASTTICNHTILVLYGDLGGVECGRPSVIALQYYVGVIIPVFNTALIGRWVL